MGFWAGIPDKSHIMRIGRFSRYGLNASFVDNGALVLRWFRTSVVSTFMVGDIACVWFRASSTSPSQLVTLGAAPTS
jgi:hypothetical protein